MHPILLLLFGPLVGTLVYVSSSSLFRASAQCTELSRMRDCGPWLVCAPPLGDVHAAPICRACISDEDCAGVAPEMECVADSLPRPAWQHNAFNANVTRKRGECKHKLLLPLDVRDMAGFLLVFVACALAAGGGIGGGGMLVPLLLVVFGFSPHDATPLSNVAILGGARGTCKLHPHTSLFCIAVSPLRG